MEAIDKVIQSVGSLQAVADAVGLKSAMAVSQWRRRGVPAERVILLCAATNYQVTPHELRPDIYPDPDWLPTSGLANGKADAA